MTKYTDDQINEAIQKAAAKNTPGPVYAWELSMYKKVIDALPEPQDDWEECAFEDLQKGDRVSEVVKQDDGTTQTIEGVASYLDTRRDKHSWKTRDGFELALDDYALDSHLVTLYRIPAPVQHPDPAEHPVILIREAVVNHDPPVVAIAMRERVCNELIYVFGEYGALRPTKITDWSPAKVVEDDR